MDNNKPTIQITATGKVVVTNAKQVTHFWTQRAKLLPQEIDFRYVIAEKTLDVPILRRCT